MQNVLDRNALVADDQSRLHTAHRGRTAAPRYRTTVASAPAGGRPPRAIGLVVNLIISEVGRVQALANAR
jgi:hypothetical protein